MKIGYRWSSGPGEITEQIKWTEKVPHAPVTTCNCDWHVDTPEKAESIKLSERNALSLLVAV